MANKSKVGYADDIESATLNNTNFRQVLFTGKLQLVLMVLQPGEDIGWEIHDDHDQFFRFEAGVGLVTIDDEEHVVKDGDAIVVPAGSKHNVKNTGDTVLKLYTIYAPPEHKPGKIHATKADALADPDYK
jgi:mannose-6-phosphate isomerase-like protein (cupin superfamily)